MAETYRDQWEAAAATLRSYANQWDELAKAAPLRPVAASAVPDDLYELLGSLEPGRHLVGGQPVTRIEYAAGKITICWTPHTVLLEDTPEEP